MSKSTKPALGAALAAVSLLALAAVSPPALADDASPRSAMPSRGFHGVPPSFQGRLPSPRNAPGAGRFALGRPGHDLGLFMGHDYAHLSPADRILWQGGGWRHEMHDGYLGWWWVVGDSWFYYPSPIYPYPAYIGPQYYYDYYSYYPAPPYYWYHCEDPLGYYPSVQDCRGPWEPVPPSP